MVLRGLKTIKRDPVESILDFDGLRQILIDPAQILLDLDKITTDLAQISTDLAMILLDLREREREREMKRMAITSEICQLVWFSLDFKPLPHHSTHSHQLLMPEIRHRPPFYLDRVGSSRVALSWKS